MAKLKTCSIMNWGDEALALLRTLLALRDEDKK